MGKLLSLPITRIIRGPLIPPFTSPIRARICKPFKGPRNRFPCLAGRYTNPICRSRTPGYTGWRNRFLASLNVYKYGLWGLPRGVNMDWRAGPCLPSVVSIMTVIYVHFSYLCNYDLYSPLHNVLDACISITRASGRGLGPGSGIELIGECHIGPKKLEILGFSFRAQTVGGLVVEQVHNGT